MPDGDRSNNRLGRGRLAPWHSDTRRLPSYAALRAQVFSCPECDAQVPEASEAEHLITVHGYLSFSGTLLPRAATLSCLWDRVFSTGDPQAHERLCGLLHGNVDPAVERSPYVTALESELLRRLDNAQIKRRADLERVVKNLRKSASAPPHFWELVQSTEPRLRQLGRELLLPDVGYALSGNDVLAAEVRRWVDQLCPNEDIWNKIFICQRLPHFGANRAAVKQCLRELEGLRTVPCPKCGEAVPPDDLNDHLRVAHRIYQFRGVTRPLPELLEMLLGLVCSAREDAEAWRMLEAVAVEVHGTGADRFLAVQVARALQALPDSERGEAFEAVADIIAESERGMAIARLLTRSSERPGRYLALALAPRLPQPMNRQLIRALRPLLARRRAPSPLQLAAVAAMLRATRHQRQAPKKVIDAFIDRCSKTRAVERLRKLEAEVGPTTAVTERCAAIENEIRLSCPRCRVEFRRLEMAKHLWSEHRLLLDGHQVREPWRLIKDWIKECRRDHDAELLARCRTLGQHVDPVDGLRVVHRLVLAYGIDDVEARQILLAEARRGRVSLCPRCFAQVPVPDDVVPRPLNVSHGRLSLEGYCVEVSERGLFPHLHIESPGQMVYDGREPGQWLTYRAAVLLAAGPLVALALLCALLLPYWGLSPFVPVVTCLAAALTAYLAVQIQTWLRPRPLDRAVDYAWTWLVPRLHVGSFSLADALFVTGLALTTPEHGQPAVRAASLQRLLRLTENAAAGGIAALVHLTALKTLEISDIAERGQDPIPALVQAVGDCFKGKPPLVFAQQLLERLGDKDWLTGNLPRLRVLLCDQAFEAGREVKELLEAGQLVPALGEILQVQTPDDLARLRLLWSLRPSRPWDRFSAATTVFELVNYPELCRTLLNAYPDLLWIDEDGRALLICGRGVVFENVLFTHAPKMIEIKGRKESDGGYEVVVGEHRFVFSADPTSRVRRLDRWFRYFLDEFQPRVAKVNSWPTPAGTHPLQLQAALPCPECQLLFVPVVGAVGVSVHPATPSLLEDST